LIENDWWGIFADCLTGGWSLKTFSFGFYLKEFLGGDFGMTLVLNRPQHASAGHLVDRDIV
jgi:hypothetical protein